MILDQIRLRGSPASCAGLANCTAYYAEPLWFPDSLLCLAKPPLVLVGCRNWSVQKIYELACLAGGQWFHCKGGAGERKVETHEVVSWVFDSCKLTLIKFYIFRQKRMFFDAVSLRLQKGGRGPMLVIIPLLLIKGTQGRPFTNPCCLDKQV